MSKMVINVKIDPKGGTYAVSNPFLLFDFHFQSFIILYIVLLIRTKEILEGKMRNIVLFFVVSCACVMIMSCATQPRNPHPFSGPVFEEETENKPWTNLNFRTDTDEFHFVVLSDRNGGGRQGIYEDAVRKVNLLQPEFVICVGDLIPGYSRDQEKIKKQRDEIDTILSKLEMPFFYVPGNHDLTYPPMRKSWEKRYGATYYHFVYKDCLFLCMNSHDTKEYYFTDTQLAYMKKALDENRNCRWTFVFFHHPLWTFKDKDSNWPKFAELLKGRRHTIFSGHTHVYMKYDVEGNDYIVLATTGGASSRIGPEYGRFDEFAWVSMTGKEPVIANLSLDGINNKNIYTRVKSELVWPIYDGRAIDVYPIIVDQPLFEGAETAIRVRNHSEYPLKYFMKLQDNPLFTSDPGKIELSIPAASDGETTMMIHALDPISLKENLQLTLEGEAVYEIPDSDPVKSKGTKALMVEKREYCPRSKTPVTIDGELDDWESLPISCAKPTEVEQRREFWKGKTDASYDFGVKYDEDYVFIGVKAIDDMFVHDPKRKPWEQDCLEVRVNGNPDPDRTNSKGEGEYEKFLLFVLNPAEKGAEGNWHEKDRLPEGCKAACLKNESGFSAEIAIPISHVKSLQGENWDAVRVNICMDDFDEGGVNDGAKIWWRPDWRSARTYPGSGTFYRQR